MNVYELLSLKINKGKQALFTHPIKMKCVYIPASNRATFMH